MKLNKQQRSANAEHSTFPNIYRIKFYFYCKYEYVMMNEANLVSVSILHRLYCSSLALLWA